MPPPVSDSMLACPKTEQCWAPGSADVLTTLERVGAHREGAVVEAFKEHAHPLAGQSSAQDEELRVEVFRGGDGRRGVRRARRVFAQALDIQGLDPVAHPRVELLR